MEPSPRPSFNLAGAGGTLIGTTARLIVLGALIGWAFGSAAWGARRRDPRHPGRRLVVYDPALRQGV